MSSPYTQYFLKEKTAVAAIKAFSDRKICTLFAKLFQHLVRARKKKRMLQQKHSRRGRNIRGSVPSRKLGRMVSYKSLLARDYIYLFEHHPRVQSYQEQPCTITYQFEGKQHRYTPDFLVSWHGRKPSIVVCKSETYINDPEHIPQWTAAQQWCEHHQHDFFLYTEKTLHPYKTFLANVHQLAVHAHQSLPAQAQEYLLKTLISLPQPTSRAELVRHTPLLAAETTRSYLWHLIYTGVIQADLTHPLHVATTQVSFQERGKE